MDGLAERRPWWDADLSQPIDVVSGTAIRLPQSLGGQRIKHSGLSHQSDGYLDAFRDSDGASPWTTTIEDIKTSLKELANSDGSNVITRFIGQSVNEPPMTPELLDDHLFSPESDGWKHKNVVLPCDALACPSTLA